MYKGQKSVRAGIEDFLCPFTDMYITQGSGGNYSHKGIYANDIRGRVAGIRYPYYAPCTSKCIKIYPESGQVMWQSTNKVRFANGRIDYATYMTAHDDTMNAVTGQVIEQGEKLGNMGTKGNATGVHCHIEVSQSNDTSWTKNQYGVYHFNNEYDLDDCYFVDYTNILYGMGGNFRTTGQSPIIEISGDKALDQIIHPGSKVMFDGIFQVDIIKRGTNLFGNTKLTGVSYMTYYNEKAESYHWIPLNDFTEVDKYGSAINQDDIVYGGESYVINKNIYTVQEIDIETNSAKLKCNDREIWIFSAFLKEVESTD